MNKELQDKAWSVLPKEFKEEVKKLYSRFLFTREGYYDELFGEHNLTSDVEGEELLYVSRKEVQKMYAHYDKISNDPNRPKDYIESVYEYADGVTMALDDLFGSKCLPDESESPKLSKVEKVGKDCNVDSLPTNVDSLSQNPPENCDKANHISTDDNKQAGPKFKVGDIAVVRGFKHPLLEHDGAIVSILSYHEKGDFYSCAIAPNVGIDVDAKYLEPYTEPEKESRNLSQETANCDKHFDNILKDSFRNERRLNIAAMAMQGILSNPQLLKIAIETYQEEIGSPDIYVAVAKTAKEQADALIAECELTEKLKGE
jgi:hypothetical protein